MQALLVLVLMTCFCGCRFGFHQTMQCFDDNQGKLITCKKFDVFSPVCGRKYGEAGGCLSEKDCVFESESCPTAVPDNPRFADYCCCGKDECNVPFTNDAGPFKCHADADKGFEYVEKTCLHGQVCGLLGSGRTAGCVFQPKFCNFKDKCTKYEGNCCCKTNLCNPPPKRVVRQCYQRAGTKVEKVTCEKKHAACYWNIPKQDKAKDAAVWGFSLFNIAVPEENAGPMSGCTENCTNPNSNGCKDSKQTECCCTTNKCNGPRSGKKTVTHKDTKSDKDKKPDKDDAKSDKDKKPDKDDAKSDKDKKPDKDDAKSDKDKKPDKDEKPESKGCIFRNVGLLTVVMVGVAFWNGLL